MNSGRNDGALMTGFKSGGSAGVTLRPQVPRLARVEV